MSTCNAWYQENVDLQNKYQLTAIVGKENKYADIAFFSDICIYVSSKSAVIVWSQHLLCEKIWQCNWKKMASLATKTPRKIKLSTLFIWNFQKDANLVVEIQILNC